MVVVAAVVVVVGSAVVVFAAMFVVCALVEGGRLCSSMCHLVARKECTGARDS